MARMRWRFAVLVAALAVGGGTAAAEPQAQCRTGFDIGSSGIRVGSTTGQLGGKVSIDYLSDVWADNVIDSTNDATAAALRELAAGNTCPAVAGAYSAWRLAAEKGGADKVAATLADLYARTGIAIFVMPQEVEGGYAYYAASRELGPRLVTPFVLDIGGGSMQFATHDNGWGAALGQKAWRKLFCAEVKASPQADCAANPAGVDAIAQSQRVLAPVVADARAKLGHGFAVTAVSAPVVRGIHPILLHLARQHPALRSHVDADGFDLAALNDAIARLAPLGDADIVDVLDGCRRTATAEATCPSRFVSSYVTDMLLLQAFMAGLEISRVQVSELDLTNVPGILGDEHAFAWASHYGCYLSRLRRQGIGAYTTSPATCGAGD
jgi:hypothetical protein